MKEQATAAADIEAALENRQNQPGSSISQEVDLSLPRMLTDRYRLERLLAKGGMGRVYLATQLPLERQVALKQLVTPALNEDFRRRFFLEASVLARLSHPNIVVVYDYGETPDRSLFMVMEYLDGVTLLDTLRKRGRLTAERTLKITAEVCRALRASHRQGVAHRDLKPGNIMLLPNKDDEKRDTVKVLDFGLVKVFQEQQEQDLERDLTRAEMMLGSPRYMAPEQIQCGAVDARADIYSVGVVLFAMLVGRPPFVGSTLEILNQHLEAQVPGINAITQQVGGFTVVESELGDILDGIVARCMEKSPADRYQSMDDLLVDLRSAYRLLADDSLDPYSTLELMRPTGASISSMGSNPPPLPFDGQEVSGERSIPTIDDPSGLVSIDELELATTSSRRGRLVMVLVTLVAVSLLVLVGLWFLRSRGRGEGPAAASTRLGAVANPRPGGGQDVAVRTSVRISSTPVGAAVSRNGVALGQTPLEVEIEVSPDRAETEFIFQLGGYQDVSVGTVIEGDTTVVHADLVPVTTPEQRELQDAGAGALVSGGASGAAPSPPPDMIRPLRPSIGTGGNRTPPRSQEVLERTGAAPSQAAAERGEGDRGEPSGGSTSTVDGQGGSRLIVDDSSSSVPVVD